MFRYIQQVIQEGISTRLCESTDNLLADIYESLTVEEKIRINKKITYAVLESFYPKIKIDLTTTTQQTGGRQRIEANPSKRCMARVGLGKQCSRARKGGHELCAGHLKSLPYGRFDGPLEGKALQVRKARGRRTIQNNTKKVAYSMKTLDTTKYIRTTLVPYEGEEYLLDEHGVLYSNTADNSIVGRVEGDTILWFK